MLVKFIKPQNLSAEQDLGNHLVQAHPFTKRYTEAQVENDLLKVISTSRCGNDRTRIPSGPSWFPLCSGIPVLNVVGVTPHCPRPSEPRLADGSWSARSLLSGDQDAWPQTEAATSSQRLVTHKSHFLPRQLHGQKYYP